jgi:hypothetical protein
LELGYGKGFIAGFQPWGQNRENHARMKLPHLLFNISVFLLSWDDISAQSSGVASGYPGDSGLGDHPKVLLFTDFSTDSWRETWSGAGRETIHIVKPGHMGFTNPWQGTALEIRVPEGAHYGASLEFDFLERTGYQPEEIYFRYYLLLGSDWDPARGGKLPGIAGTYGRGGWGGRPSDGINGWSARGLFKGQRDGITRIGYYCYHADMKGRYGSEWVWESEEFKGLENNRWYCIEQFVKMNTPGSNDGVLRGWVDGELIFERNDIRMRDTEDLKVENIWINVYHGGSWSAISDDSLYLDNIVISKEYIGPMAR